MTLPLSNTVDGRILAPAASEDLAVGYLAKLNSDGEAELAGLTSHPVAARFVVVDSDDNNAALMPLSPSRQVRVILSGTCAYGDQLSGTSAGKAIKLASGATGSCPILVAEEDGVDGQLVLCRGLPAYVKPDEIPAYTAADALKVPQVNSGGTALQLVAPSAFLPAIAAGDGGKVLSVNAAETGVEYSRNNLHAGDVIWGQNVTHEAASAVIQLTKDGFNIQNEGGNLHSFLRTGAIIFSNLPTSDPSVAGQLWNDTGTLKVSAGA